MNKYKKIFEDVIANKRHPVHIEGAFKRADRTLILSAINELIQRKDIQNIHDIGNGNFIIEYEPEVTQ
jgi:hypothetical protein